MLYNISLPKYISDFLVLELRKRTRKIEHDHITSVSEYICGQPRQDITHEIMELQGQFRQQDNQTSDNMDTQIFHFQTKSKYIKFSDEFLYFTCKLILLSLPDVRPHA